ncbi:ABC transporter ATP-binding protein [Halobaculum gomorrense]|uniref:Amino acid/amide ABC transporter ATP-binding protein 1, HAAT family n=1 Tax=Halobaculum gomorrense TaxID=43928 RepID=A0A1M5PL48_9EURY|nr:ABC transporter ATP-binding protein [Halobaculum gomorrense]SHH02430.1 amino acid/amide ABC transporter ATP-binding protein 1, HAAT family [Halobaculum gomorrense]
MLRTRGLTKRFGGLTAVDAVDFDLGGDELCSLIGPNGAGKTTFFNLLTGVLEPTEGTVELRTGPASTDGASGAGDDGNGDGDDWRDLTGAAPHEVANLGVHRSYQVTNVFANSTVLENVRVAAQAADGAGTNFWRNAGQLDRYIEEAYDILDRVGLADSADVPARALSHGAKRQLEVGVALAGDPDVLLLDEPNAGVSSESVDRVVDLIEDVAADHAVLLVEHNMDIVMEVSDRVVVLNQGAVIADDEPAAVRDDPAVQRAYLGGYEPGTAGGDAAEGTGDPDGADGTDGGEPA